MVSPHFPGAGHQVHGCHGDIGGLYRLHGVQRRVGGGEGPGEGPGVRRPELRCTARCTALLHRDAVDL